MQHSIEWERTQIIHKKKKDKIQRSSIRQQITSSANPVLSQKSGKKLKQINNILAVLIKEEDLNLDE